MSFKQMIKIPPKEIFSEKNKLLFYLIIFSLLLTYLLLLIKTAWLSDDAYITFRTIDNFVSGYGLAWNIVERVQSFTHPLWLFLLSAVYFFTQEIFFTSLIVSMLISLVTIYILSFRLPVSIFNTIITLLIVVFSKAFIDYSTSGLENPLTNLLLTIFGYIYIKKETTNSKTFLLAITSSLILLNRMDCFLLIFPTVIYYIVAAKGFRSYLIILIGIFPIIFWELFSIFYFGFLFPNTAYAKLNTGINRLDLIFQGLKYFYDSLKLDPLTIPVIFVGILFSIKNVNEIFRPLAIGVLLYLFYLIWIGGDFMSGRFFVAPLVISLLIWGNQNFISNKWFALITLGIIIISFLGPFPTVLGEKFPRKGLLINEDGICDERVFYMPGASLLFSLRGKEMPVNRKIGLLAKKENSKFEKVNNIGVFGYYVGRQCYVLDDFALTDPLLSRLPAIKNSRIGHFKRQLPEGYEQTLITGKNRIKNPDLAKYYDILVLIIRDDLWSVKRLQEIWKINTGQYNYLLNNYISSLH